MAVKETLGPAESRSWHVESIMCPPSWEPRITPLAPSYWAGMRGTWECPAAPRQFGMEAVPGQELAGIQNLVLPFPLDVRNGVPLCLALEHGCVALVHRCGLWLQLEGDENCRQRGRQEHCELLGMVLSSHKGARPAQWDSGTCHLRLCAKH